MHFQFNDEYEHSNAQCGIQLLHCDGRSFSYELQQKMQYIMHLPVHAVYRAVHLWWCTMLSMTGDSAAADDEQHLTVVNDLAGVSIGTLATSVVLQ